MSDMPVFQNSITTKSPNYQYPNCKTMGNGHCRRVINPHLKSKSQAIFGNTGLFYQVGQGNSNGNSNCHHHSQRSCSSFFQLWFIRDIALGPGSQFQKQFVTTNTGCTWYNYEQQPTTLLGMECWRDLTAHFYKCCMHVFVMSQIGRNFFHW